jgi:hypothetical protein
MPLAAASARANASAGGWADRAASSRDSRAFAVRRSRRRGRRSHRQARACGDQRERTPADSRCLSYVVGSAGCRARFASTATESTRRPVR